MSFISTPFDMMLVSLRRAVGDEVVLAGAVVAAGDGFSNGVGFVTGALSGALCKTDHH